MNRIEKLSKLLSELGVDNMINEIRELKAEIRQLKADNVRLQEVNDTYQGEIFKLEAEIKLDEGVILARNKEVDDLKADIKDLKHDNKRLEQEHTMISKEYRLIKQVSSNRGSNSNTIQGEIDEYMSHNDTCKGVRLFLIPIEEFSHGWRSDGYLYWDDGIK